MYNNDDNNNNNSDSISIFCLCTFFPPSFGEFYLFTAPVLVSCESCKLRINRNIYIVISLHLLLVNSFLGNKFNN